MKSEQSILKSEQTILPAYFNDNETSFIKQLLLSIISIVILVYYKQPLPILRFLNYNIINKLIINIATIYISSILLKILKQILPLYLFEIIIYLI